MSFRRFCAVLDFVTYRNLVHPSGLICSCCSYTLELPFSRFVTSPQLFFRFGIPHADVHRSAHIASVVPKKTTLTKTARVV